MKCYRCRSKGIDSTMIKNHGYAYCPECGREVRYRISAGHNDLNRTNPKSHRSANTNPGCLTKLVLLVFGLIVLASIIVSNPWLLFLLLLPLGYLIWKLSTTTDDDDE